MKTINSIFRILFELYLVVISSIPTTVGKKLRYIAYKPLFKKTKGYFSIDTGVTILGFENIELGNNVVFSKNSYVYAHNEGILIIGDNFGLNSNSQLGASHGKIIVGNECQIASNCILRSSNHRYDDLNTPIMYQGHEYGEIILEDDVWIASNSVITANTKVGKGSIVAAGSVVTKDVKPYTIVAGVPAKFISSRKDFSE